MLAKHNRKRSKQVGLPPGTLIHVGEKKSGTVRIRQIIYKTIDIYTQMRVALETGNWRA
jgi:hypothetical protein